MAEFNLAVEAVLANEGEYVDNPTDSGGATNFGISLRFLRDIPEENLRKYGIFGSPELLSVENVKTLTLDQAKLIYKGEFWDKAAFNSLGSQALTNCLFDCAVLHGLSASVKLLQRAIWGWYRNMADFPDDGLLGKNTLFLANNTPSMNLLPVLRAERAGLMRLIVQERNKDKEFLNGWLNRAYST